jgi:THO complex subunit 2
LTDLNRWYSERSVYEKEAIGPSIPGFRKKWNNNPADSNYLQYEEYRQVMMKWHKNITHAFKNCLESRDYMHVRNAFAVLEKIIGQYPQVDYHGATLEEKISLISSKTETREDLRVRADGYLALLRKSSKSWVSPDKFSSMSKPSASPARSSTPTSKRQLTPQPPPTSHSLGQTPKTPDQQRIKSSSLNPAATAFKPEADTSRYVV